MVRLQRGGMLMSKLVAVLRVAAHGASGVRTMNDRAYLTMPETVNATGCPQLPRSLPRAGAVSTWAAIAAVAALPWDDDQSAVG